MLQNVVPTMMSDRNHPGARKPHPPRKKQPKLFSRVRPGKVDPFAPSAIAMSTLPSLATTIQAIENRVGGVPDLHSGVALVDPVKNARELPPLPGSARAARAGGKEDGVSAPEGTAVGSGSAGNPSNTATSDGGEAAVHELISASGCTVPDMHGLTSNISKSGQKGRSVYPDTNLAEAWLNEVLAYGIREFGDTETIAIPTLGGDDVPLSGTEQMRVGRPNLQKVGLNESDISRIYRALYVYSVGFHEMVRAVTFSFFCATIREIWDFNREKYGTNRESVTLQISEVVGATADRTRAVVDILRTFNWVCEVIQR
eukprot:SAG31_NODE_837_length_11633_cov_18.437663_8_plen_314_part_00